MLSDVVVPQTYQPKSIPPLFDGFVYSIRAHFTSFIQSLHKMVDIDNVPLQSEPMHRNFL